MELTKEQLERYSRHITLKEFGVEGQKKLLASKVLVIGTGGLGSPVLMYLAAAGIGTIGIVDDDVVDYSNLQRQVIHQTKDVGVLKTESAKNKINALNPEIKVNVYNTFITPDNILDIIKDYDFILFLDQDSIPSKNLVAKLLKNYQFLLNKKINLMDQQSLSTFSDHINNPSFTFLLILFFIYLPPIQFH